MTLQPDRSLLHLIQPYFPASLSSPPLYFRLCPSVCATLLPPFTSLLSRLLLALQFCLSITSDFFFSLSPPLCYLPLITRVLFPFPSSFLCQSISTSLRFSLTLSPLTLPDPSLFVIFALSCPSYFHFCRIHCIAFPFLLLLPASLLPSPFSSVPEVYPSLRVSLSLTPGFLPLITLLSLLLLHVRLDRLFGLPSLVFVSFLLITLLSFSSPFPSFLSSSTTLNSHTMSVYQDVVGVWRIDFGFLPLYLLFGNAGGGAGHPVRYFY